MSRFLPRGRWQTYATVALLLFATSGTVISRTTCLMAGHTVWAVGAMEDCCPEAPPVDGPAFTAECCVYGQAGAAADPFLGNAPHVITDIADMPCPGTSMPAIAASDAIMVGSVESRPPPLITTERLAVLSVFRL